MNKVFEDAIPFMRTVPEIRPIRGKSEPVVGRGFPEPGILTRCP